MLNQNKERELAYVVIIDKIQAIPGYDRVELAVVGGWTVVVGKNEFKAGEPAIYFEIDSQLPNVEPFSNFQFLAKKNFKIKTQKMCKSISQGFLASAKDLGWTFKDHSIYDAQGNEYNADNESRFLTQKLGVVYATAEDNSRKASTPDKYKKMAQRHPQLFQKKPFKWLMKREWGKKFLFLFFGKSKDKKNDWPQWVVKTDEERIENMPYLFDDKSVWIATEKIDGTSTTFTLKKGKFFSHDKFFVCSRNVVFDTPKKGEHCFYDTNVYLEMAEKYHIFKKMTTLLHTQFSDCDWITIQGETYGKGIQKREYGLYDHKFMAFNFITSKGGRFNTICMKELLEDQFGIPCVPILNENYVLPDTIEQLRDYVNSQPSVLDNKIKEGIVFRSIDGTRSFKCVSPEFLLEYHS